jgi:hypothetical protein
VLELVLRTIMEIRARPTLLPAMPRRAIGVISSRMRWKDHFSTLLFLSQTSAGNSDCGAHMTPLAINQGAGASTAIFWRLGIGVTVLMPRATALLHASLREP